MTKTKIHKISADVSKCNNQKCPSKESCLRFIGISDSKYQRYSKFYFQADTGLCDHFINVKNNMTWLNTQ